MQTVLTTLAQTADAELHYTRRPDSAKFSASTLLQTLVWGWLAHPDASLEQLAQSAARVGVSVSPQAIEQRFSFATASLLRTVLSASLDQLLASDPVAIPLLKRFAGVFVHDSTTIVLPDALADQLRGCGGSTSSNTAAALKCGLQLDLLHGRYSALDLVEGRAADQRLPLQQASLPPHTRILLRLRKAPSPGRLAAPAMTSTCASARVGLDRVCMIKDRTVGFLYR
jgi:hypothetical protein